MRISVLTLCGWLLLAQEARAFEPAWLPGGEETKKAVAARRNQTALSKVALAMKPGTWADVECERPHNLMSVSAGKDEDGKERHYHIAGWTDDGHWDSRNGQFLFMGFRKNLKFISYKESENVWRQLPCPFGWDVPEEGTFKDERTNRYGHVYAKNAYDSEKGVFYHALAGHTYRYAVAEGKWTRFDGGGSMNLEFFPGKGLMAHQGRSTKSAFIEILDEPANKWATLAQVPSHGYHALARYNPLLNEMLLISGNDDQTVTRVKASGEVTKMQDTPFDLTIRGGRLVVDYASGLYLIFHDGELHEFDSVKNEYRKVEGHAKPWEGSAEMPVPAAIPEYGVTMWIDKKLRLYKHEARPPVIQTAGK